MDSTCPSGEEAGKAPPCQGCPNQKICASGATSGPDPDVSAIASKLSGVKKKILILSGKGGVGKSTLTKNISQGLAASMKDTASGDGQRSPLNVGVLDIDLVGPSLPRIFGVEGESVFNSGSGWSPVYVSENLCLMSSGFLLPSLESAVIWRGPKKNNLIKHLLKDVDWGELDILLIDTPPGTGDEHISIVQYLSEAKIDGAIIVTTPQNISLLDVRKEIDFCSKVKLPILGIVENMSGFTCPTCLVTSDILPRTSGGAEALCKETGLPLLAKIPLDQQLAKICDGGENLFESEGESPSSSPQPPFRQSYSELLNNLKQILFEKPPSV